LRQCTPPCLAQESATECESGAAGELAGFGGDFDLFAFLDEERDADFGACFEAGGLGDAAGGCVAANGGLGVLDGELDLLGQFEADGIAVVLLDLNDGAFEKHFECVAHHLAVECVGFEGGLVEEVRAVGVAVEIGRGYGFEVGFFKFVFGLEGLVLHGIGEHVAHLDADEGLAATCGRGGDVLFEAAVGCAFEFEKHFALYVDGVDECGHWGSLNRFWIAEQTGKPRRSKLFQCS
jgi:hypothetical protein